MLLSARPQPPKPPTVILAATLYFLYLGLCPALETTAVTASEYASLQDLTSLSLEQLMAIEVTSVSKRPQKLLNSAAAIFVLTNEDLMRSGATSIPEALRMVPGVEVARIDGSKWAISVRGFNSRFSNKLLVLLDGRIVYSPLFSGVLWDIQDLLLDDVDRIEVIRGPGASLWGANAVNGVINIITKTAKDTQGTLLTGGAGTEERGFGGIRHGGKLTEKMHYRVFGKYFDRDNQKFPSGGESSDGWDYLRGGFRLDWEKSPRDQITVSGEMFDGEAGQTVNEKLLVSPFSQDNYDPSETKGGHILARWERGLGKRSNMALQFYYDRFESSDDIADINVDVYDADFQHRFASGDAHDVVWGIHYRVTQNTLHSSSFSSLFIPPYRTAQLFSGFVQDDITLMPGRLFLTVGTKVEHNSFTAFEYQPTARVLWKVDQKNTFWSAVSRAVRTPYVGENNAVLNGIVAPSTAANPGPLPLVVRVYRNPDLRSEDLLAYEVGYRTLLSERLSVDFTAFYNRYRDLVTFLQSSGDSFVETFPSPVHVVAPFQAQNKMEGESYGGELSAEIRMTPKWRLKAAYSFLQIQLHLVSGGTDTAAEAAGEKRSPHHQLSLRSSVDIRDNVQFDAWLRYVDNLPDLNIPSYVTLDLRLGWKPRKNMEVSVVGQNLLDSQRPEFISEIVDTRGTEVQRGVYVNMKWTF